MSEPSIREVPSGPMSGFLMDLVRAVRRAFREFPTKSELERVGVIGVSGGSVTAPPAPPRVVPPSPTGVSFAATITNILVDFEQAAYTGHAYSELLRADTDSYGDAVVVSRINGAVGAYPTGPDKQGYFWVRHVSHSATAGPPNNQAGTLLKTGQDPTDLFNSLSAAARAGAGPYSELAVRADDFSVVSPTTDQPVFTVVTTPYTNNGVNVPVGVYFADGFILRGSIVNATIANAAIDNAKIANVSAAKITAGSIAVGEYIGSSNYIAGVQGWRINGNGSAELRDAVVRGTVFASAGEIGGITIGGNYLQSSNYVMGVSGFRLNSDGTGFFSGKLTTAAIDAVGTTNIANLAITNAKIANAQIDYLKLATGAASSMAAIRLFGGSALTAGDSFGMIDLGTINVDATGLHLGHIRLHKSSSWPVGAVWFSAAFYSEFSYDNGTNWYTQNTLHLTATRMRGLNEFTLDAAFAVQIDAFGGDPLRVRLRYLGGGYYNSSGVFISAPTLSNVDSAFSFFSVYR